MLLQLFSVHIGQVISIWEQISSVYCLTAPLVYLRPDSLPCQEVLGHQVCQALDEGRVAVGGRAPGDPLGANLEAEVQWLTKILGV